MVNLKKPLFELFQIDGAATSMEVDQFRLELPGEGSSASEL